MKPRTHEYILITGANSGLGLGICTRVLDEFLASRPATHSLTLIFTTRSARKSEDTLRTLRAHVLQNPAENGPARIHLRPESVELTSLLSVRSLARKLLSSDLPYLNAVVANAGIGGWSGLNWPVAVATVLADMRTATTWPTFKSSVVGLTTKSQFPATQDGTKFEEPPLAEVFTANLFGHYLLAYWLMPLLRACEVESPGKFVWVSGIEASKHHYNPNDHEGFLSDAAYENSKRISDCLALTSTHPATRKYVEAFFTPTPSQSQNAARPQTCRPKIQTSHPGIVVTTIVSLYWIVHQAYYLAILFARLLGAPWSTVDVYTAAASATFLALASQAELESKEHEDTPSGGQGKWGSSVSRLGTVTVRRTDVEGYGINGSGEPFKDSWWGGRSWWGGPEYLGRTLGARDANKEDVQEFFAQGAAVWREMESLRVEWLDRLDEWDRRNGTENGAVVPNGRL